MPSSKEQLSRLAGDVEYCLLSIDKQTNVHEVLTEVRGELLKLAASRVETTCLCEDPETASRSGAAYCAKCGKSLPWSKGGRPEAKRFACSFCDKKFWTAEVRAHHEETCEGGEPVNATGLPEEPKSPHPTEDDFQHWLSYSGVGAASDTDLRAAFYAGANVPPPEKASDYPKPPHLDTCASKYGNTYCDCGAEEPSEPNKAVQAGAEDCQVGSTPQNRKGD